MGATEVSAASATTIRRFQSRAKAFLEITGYNPGCIFKLSVFEVHRYLFCLVSFTLDVGFVFFFHSSSMYFSVPGLVWDFLF